MSQLTAKQLTHLRNQLLQDQKDLTERLEKNEHYGLNDPIATFELSSYDNHPADIGTELFEQSKDLALNEQAEFQLQDIEFALDSMDAGTYGQCLHCGKSIPYERLEAVPTAKYCVDHVPDKNLSDRRPVEEKFLRPPFGRTSLDEEDATQFDGEDAWQVVAGWGTSNSPAMDEDRESLDYDNVFIESDEQEGFVEPIESFVATDIYGNKAFIVRNDQYKKYMEDNEGANLLD